ncbi:MAG: 16S rRNA (guanine(527)-N(7))-methyltransferase RsmG [Acidimicrobiia bacterium]
MDEHLVAQLERSRQLGFLGPGPIEAHLRHSRAYLRPLAGVVGTVVDLGSGGGVPGLVVAAARPDLHLVLLDSMAKRCRFLAEAVAALGLDAEVVEGRAEEVGRSDWRGRANAVVARSFGPPAATAECAAPLLKVGGRLIVSEPPDSRARWPEHELKELGLRPTERLNDGAFVQVLEQVVPCPARYPRRTGIPTKRPLF